jgi:hypothetical protein
VLVLDLLALGRVPSVGVRGGRQDTACAPRAEPGVWASAGVTLAPDDTQSSGPVPNARLLPAEGASVFAQRMGEPPSKTRRIERTELASDAAGLADAQTPCTRETR